MATREKKKETRRKGGKTRFFRMWALQIDNAERQRKAPTDRRRHDTKERREKKVGGVFSQIIPMASYSPNRGAADSTLTKKREGGI